MDSWNLLLEIVALLAVALLFGLAAQRLKQNALVGYLLAGIVVGPRSLGLVQNVETVQVLAELGAALLLFTIGLEFSWRTLRDLGRVATVGGTLQIGLTISVTTLAGWALGASLESAFVIGCTLALSSTAVVLRILSDRTELDSIHGRNALGILLLQDIAIVPLIIIISVVGEGRQGMDALLELGFGLVKAGGLILVFYVFLRHVIPGVFRLSTSHRDREVPVVLAVTTCVGCTWASHWIGLSPVLGAFASGILLADLPYAEQIRADVVPLRAVFVTLFFASIGMLATIPSGMELLMVPLFVVVVVLLKSVVVTVVLLLLKQPLRIAVRTGIILAQIGEFSFVLAQTANQQGILGDQLFHPLLSASVITLALSPYLSQLAPRAAVVISTLLRRRSPQLAVETEKTTADGDRVIVVGYGPAGRAVVRTLKDSEIEFLVLELNPKTVESEDRSLPTRLGDATSREILNRARITQAKALVITIPDPEIARTVIRQARSLAPKLPIVTRSRYNLYAQSLLHAGAERVVNEEEVVGQRLSEETLSALVEKGN